ncbi:NPCBM/NEW2 domain-containing protein [Candidatus Soleaferrea massiliensis]|uniref:NPCBM/NEW2 domain-containing protein n=1 Tax=Candidatus Soleaferrea massiliensis TaxID=1470354 RepID=UPI00058EB870|nr:NPCBM/NEW2 domain-containing protein [Candidatus Soleaferrea massiliensis]
MKKTTKMFTVLSVAALSACMLSMGVGAHDNGAAKTPPMGWSSWNAFQTNIDDDLITSTADAMKEHGLTDLGYEYINLDDNWQASARDINGRLQSDPIRFPDGIKGLADYVHERGMKIGLYTSNGLYTCQDLPASVFNEERDAASFAQWGVDYFKYDYCHNVQLSTMSYGIREIQLAKPFEKGTEVKTYPASSAQLQGNAYMTNGYIDGLHENAGSATFTVTVPEDGEYALNLVYIRKYSDSEVPMFIDINGDSVHPVRMMLPPVPAHNGAWARGSAMLELKAGENTLRFYNPIRSSYRDADSARYNYGTMRDALMKATKAVARESGEPERPICFSICEWGGRQPWTWGPQTGNMWRTTGDIGASWGSVMSIYDVNVELYPYAGPDKGWNDPDMLQVGNGSLTRDENVSHFSLWCMMASPLILGNDLRVLDERQDILEIITNEDAIAVDQDAMGVQGIRFKDDGDLEYLAKPLQGGKLALLMLNRSDSSAMMHMEISEIGSLIEKMDAEYYGEHYRLADAPSYRLRDVWEKHEDGSAVETVSGIAAASVPSHGVKMYIVEPAGAVDKGAYIFGSLSNSSLRTGSRTILTAKFVNGGQLAVENAAFILNLPEGFTAKPITTNTVKDLATGESFEIQWLVTAGEQELSNVPITIAADLLYEDRTTDRVTFNTFVSVKARMSTEGLTPVDYGPLTTTNWVSGKAGWGSIHQDQSVEGRTLTINGKTYAAGMGTHAPSEMIYYIGGRNITFTALAGIDDEAAAGVSSVSFQIYGDDDLLYETGRMGAWQDAKEISVDLAGCDFLRLVVDDLDGMNNDHADWIDPKIEEGNLVPVTGALTTKNWMSYTGWTDPMPRDGLTIDGIPMELGGVEYSGPQDGFQGNSPMNIAYYLGGQPVVFTSKIGIGDDMKNNAQAQREFAEHGRAGTVDYQIWGDDDLLYEKHMDLSMDPVDVSIPMEGYKLLRLVVTIGGDDTRFDHACFAMPRVTVSAEPLKALIEDAQAFYDNSVEGILNGQTPAEVRTALLEAIDAAQTAADKEGDASAEEISAACRELRAAMTAFGDAKVVVDRYELCMAIIRAKLLNPEDYPLNAWEKLQAVYLEALRVYDTELVSQRQADDAAAALNEAIRNIGIVPGDVNGNGVLDTSDLELIQKYISGKIAFTPEQMLLADYNGDGKINVIDLLNWKLQLLNG